MAAIRSGLASFQVERTGWNKLADIQALVYDISDGTAGPSRYYIVPGSLETSQSALVYLCANNSC